ncbi:MAG: peptidoglycan-binding protein [Nannocystaceae bacterium]|nr:peptidoglycan-binding protein [Nannocystaceae bacterium]
MRSPCHGRRDSSTIQAIQQFQRDEDLEPTGEADEVTRDRLVAAHRI